jgi:lipoate-protein ligase A
MENNWRFLNTGLRDGSYNMALDRVLANSVRQGKSLPVVRFFGWNPPAVSLGYNQKLSDLNFEECRRAGFDVVRRPTGGRAVIHQDEFTYSVIAPENDPMVGGSIMHTYGRIAEALLMGLKELGVNAEMVRSTAPDVSGRGSALCFAAAGRYEITFKGKKLIGSAQRRMDGMILQQGSLLLACGQKQDFFADSSARNQAGTLREILDREITYDEAAASMQKGFKEAWGIDLLMDRINKEEDKEALDQSKELKLV